MAGGRQSGRMGRSVHGLWLVACWCLTLGLAYTGAGEWLGELAEGISPVYLPTGSLLLSALCAVIALWLTLLWAARPPRGEDGSGAGPADLDRRRFLTRAIGVGVSGLGGSGLAALGRNVGWLTVTGPAIGAALPTEARVPRAEWEGARIRQYRRLGRTDFDISDISLSATGIRPDAGGEDLVLELLERGVNYFDTAPDYSAGRSELALGCALHQERGRIFVSTKFCTPQGHLPAQASVQDYMLALEGSLSRLGTDYVDLVFIHACNSVERLLSESAHEAFDRLRAQGKVRFLGVATHTPNLESVARAAIGSGRFDVMMLAYQRGAWPDLSGILSSAASSGIGIIATELLQGARHEGLLERMGERDSYPQAAFRWALKDPRVAALAVPFRDARHIDEYLFASGQRPQAQELPVQL